MPPATPIPPPWPRPSAAPWPASPPCRAPRPAGTPFASCPPALLEEVTAAIAEAAGHSFFVARILAATQAAQPAIPDPADPAWRARPAPGRRARLCAATWTCAWARGRRRRWICCSRWPTPRAAACPGKMCGRCWLTPWPPAAVTPTRTCYGWPATPARSSSKAAPSPTGLPTGSTTVPWPRTCSPAVTRPPTSSAITTALTSHVPRRPSGRRDWPASHPYTRAHLATHAARGGSIDDLAQDPGFLLAADPPELLAALDTTTSRPARAAAGAYRSALPLIRRHSPAEHAAYLGLAARCGRAEHPRRPHRRRRPGRPMASPLGILAAATPPPAAHRPRRVRCSRWRRRSWTAARWSSPAATTRRCGCGTWPPGPRSAIPFTGHDGEVLAVAAAELDGRPVVISGSSDQTVRVWDLATGDPGRRPFTGHDGVGARGGGGRAGRPPGGHLRQQRRDGAGVGPGHRDPGRRPVHRPRRVR